MIKWIFILVLLGIISSGVYAENAGEEVTPYGDHCSLCGAYGYCNKLPAYKEITNALEIYYAKKGMQVVIIKQDGRFIEAEVTKNKKTIDRILLDCKTGRIRSIY